MPSARLHHIDALRAFAMLLGIGLHAALSFAGTLWIALDTKTDETFRWFFEAVHGFRMHLFFFVSGYFTMLLWRRRGLSALLEHRFQRVAVPLLLGLVTIVPLMGIVTVWSIEKTAEGNPATPRPAVKSALVEAVRQKDSERVAQLLNASVDPNTLDTSFGIPPLGWAALHGDTRIARMLLDGGANVNGKDRGGYTPLHSAAFTGRVEVVELLLERGADADARGPRDDTPRDSAETSWASTFGLTMVLGVSTGPQKQLAANRTACVERLDKQLATQNQTLRAMRAQLNQWRTDYREWLISQRWAVKLDPFRSPTHLITASQFAHLWFLWFLCWYFLLFAVFALPASYLPIPRLPSWLLSSRLRLLWLIPLAVAPQLFMGTLGGGFGPDTAIGVLPPPHLLAFYGVFFFAGVLYHDADDRTGRFGRWWWLWLPLATGSFYLAKERVGDSLASGPLQVMYAWAAILGLFGLFRQLLSGESRVVRYLSDSAYWLYLIHLPLVVYLQAYVRDWDYPAWQKFASICVVVTAGLLVSYQLLVRHTYLGRILNGPRGKKADPEPAEQPPHPKLPAAKTDGTAEGS